MTPNTKDTQNGYNRAASSHAEAEHTLEGIDRTELNAETAPIVAHQAELRASIDASVADLEGSAK